MQKILYLASTSPRRKQLLEQIGLKFKIMPSDFEENMNLKMSHKELAKTLSFGKAYAIAQKLKNGIVIGCDTFLVFNDKRIGKPKSKKHAEQILKAISNRTIEVYSGVALIDLYDDRAIVDVEKTLVKIKKLTPNEISDYIATGEPLDKAGAFAIQGKGAALIEKINGCYSNVIGLPLYKLNIMLQKAGYNIWKN